MTDPHFEPLAVANCAETLYTNLYLTSSTITGDYALHIKLRGDHGLHEPETLNADYFDDLGFSEQCSLNGSKECHWMGLGRKEGLNSEAIINATFDRFKKHIDRLLLTAWDYRCALRNFDFHSADF